MARNSPKSRSRHTHLCQVQRCLPVNPDGSEPPGFGVRVQALGGYLTPGTASGLEGFNLS